MAQTIKLVKKNTNNVDPLKAKMQGKEVITERKVKNNQGSQLYKLDQATEAMPTRKITHELAQTIQRKRCENKMTQEDLARRASIDVNIVKNYEKVGSVVELKYLQKISRVLKTPLKMPVVEKIVQEKEEKKK